MIIQQGVKGSTSLRFLRFPTYYLHCMNLQTRFCLGGHITECWTWAGNMSQPYSMLWLPLKTVALLNSISDNLQHTKPRHRLLLQVTMYKQAATLENGNTCTDALGSQYDHKHILWPTCTLLVNQGLEGQWLKLFEWTNRSLCWVYSLLYNNQDQMHNRPKPKVLLQQLLTGKWLIINRKFLR